MKDLQELGLKFSQSYRDAFRSMQDSYADPSVRSQIILKKLRQYEPAIAHHLGGRGMALRLFWFLNPRIRQPQCKVCGVVDVTVDKVTRTFRTYCSHRCRNLDPAFREKAFSRFGGHPMKDPRVRAKAADTWARHFQGGHPSRDPEARKRMHAFRFKKAKDVYGGVHNVQGYEDRVASTLICSNLITDPEEMPVISYIYDGKSRKYFPDMLAYLPVGDGSMSASGNFRERLIEVKSAWTFVKEFEKNVAKFDAAVKYCERIHRASFWLVVVLRSGRMIWSKNPTRARLEHLKERLS